MQEETVKHNLPTIRRIPDELFLLFVQKDTAQRKATQDYG